MRAGNQHGFTLIELVIVIIILGVLSSIAIPHYLNIQKEAKIATTKGKLAAIRGGIELAHAKILASGVNTGPSGNNPDWPTLEEVQYNELRLITRPQSLQHLRLVRSNQFTTGQNNSLPECNLPDMPPGMVNGKSAVSGRTAAEATSNPRSGNEASCWAYYPGDERDANGNVIDAVFYVNDDRIATDNVDAADRKPVQW